MDYPVSIAQLRVVSPFRLGNSIAGSLAPFTWNKSEGETIGLQNKVVWLSYGASIVPAQMKILTMAIKK